MNELTTDAYLHGRLQIKQERNGYRFSLDAALLAAVPEPKPGDTLIDLGTGCGIIPLIIASRHPKVKILAVEMQADLAKLAANNVAANHMQGQVTVIQRDMRSLKMEDIGQPADWIVANPPYHQPNSGRINPNAQRALARHEINLNLVQLLETTRRLLRTGGRFGIIYPSDRIVDVLSEMRSKNIEPKWMRPVYAHDRDDAKLILVQGVQNGRPGLVMAPPLTVYEPDERYTQEVQNIMAP